jgi:uncharacterized protein YyaL (SSP411 family)
MSIVPMEEDPLRMSTAGQIHWLPWGPDAFAKAQEADKPLLLSIGAVWCYWCQVMDQTTYADPEVGAYIQQNFVPVRVDNDHRPDVNSRYNVGGWPTTCFLTPHGGIIGGATYLPADQLLAMLTEVHRAYRDEKVQLYDQGNGLLQQRREQVGKARAGAEIEEVLVDRIARRVTGTYDARNGGFGEDLKFPGAPILQFLLHLYRTTGEQFYRVMLERTLDSMVQGELLDRVEGGFFRYCANADWSQAQHEKLLEDNLSLTRVFLDAALLLDRADYLDVASSCIDYLLDHLYDEEAGGFRGSQGAHSDYFAMPPQAREGLTPPQADPFCYVSSSAQSVSLLLEASWKLPRPELLGKGLRVLERLDSLALSGQLCHVFDGEGPRRHSGGDLLVDWAHLLNALVDAYNQTIGGEGFRKRAEEVAQKLLGSFADARNGGFFDVEESPEAVGYLRVREKPLPENIAAVTGLMKLDQATFQEEYREVVRAALSAFVDANRVYGEFAASYGMLLDQYLHEPLEITVEGNFGEAGARELLGAAAQVSRPHLVIKAVPLEEAGSMAQAHVCLNTVCLPPVETPEALLATVAGATSGEDDPFPSIFQIFPGS